VYLADGTLVTTSTTTSGLWSGSLVNPITESLSGPTSNDYVWTGTYPNGVGAIDFYTPILLGSSSGYALIGQTLMPYAPEAWVWDTAIPTTNQFAMYGISQALIVPSSVPEPSTLLMAGTAIGAGFAFGWSRRREGQRRRGPVGRSGATQ
jgi:PEP-CTERM motif